MRVLLVAALLATSFASRGRTGELPIHPFAGDTGEPAQATEGLPTTQQSVHPVVGPLVPRLGAEPVIGPLDARYPAAEVATYNAWVVGGGRGADGSSHYGALRSRYQWSVRNGLPVGPSAPSNSVYAHGVEMTRAMLSKYSRPNKYQAAPHNNTALADVELLYLLEADEDALAHLKGTARYLGALYIDRYFDLKGVSSDPRSSAILLQIMNAAARLGLDYTGRPAWGSSWKEAAVHMVGRMAEQIGDDGKVISQAHKNSGQGDEAFFMNAMLATELLRWHGFVEAQPEWLKLAQRITDHLIAENERRGSPCLPYVSNGRGCASDLAAFYVWPALVLWQETRDPRYRVFALSNLRAAQKAFLGAAKQFNQAYSTGAQSAEALLAGVSWR